MSAKRARKPKLYRIESFTKYIDHGYSRVHHIASMNRASAIKCVLSSHPGGNTYITAVILLGDGITVSAKRWGPTP